MRHAAELTCTVVDCEEPGGPAPLVIQLNPLLQANLCAEHGVLVKAGAPWFARPVTRG